MKEVLSKMPNEIWKPINGYEGLYEVSNFGRMKSFQNGNERILRGHRDKNGYIVIRLPEDGVFKYRLLHRIIAQTFIPNPEDKPFVDHINTIPSDNRVENLRWATEKENSNNPITRLKYSFQQDKIFQLKQRMAMPHRKPVDMLSLNGEYIKTFDSVAHAAESVGSFCSAIRRCCNGKQHTAVSYKWRYSTQSK